MSARISLVTALIALLVATNISSAIADQSRLDKIHLDIVDKHTNVKHLSAVEFQAMEASEVVVFDVREVAEFAVSHIDGAIRVDPDIELSVFTDKYAKSLAGKTAVFYCSVGRRSSELLSQLSGILETNGALAAYNLSGGVFSWHNQQRPLMSLTKQETSLIHPFNFYWGRLINDRSAIRYKP